MVDYGPIPFLNAAVVVIPVLVIALLAPINARDEADPTHRFFASSTALLGLLFGIGGEVAGLQALLTGPTRETIPTIDAGLLGLAGAALAPRLAELQVPRDPDLARRIAHRFLPLLMGTSGIIYTTLHLPLWFRIMVYIALAFSWQGTIFMTWTSLGLRLPKLTRGTIRAATQQELEPASFAEGTQSEDQQHQHASDDNAAHQQPQQGSEDS